MWESLIAVSIAMPKQEVRKPGAEDCKSVFETNDVLLYRLR